MKLLRKILTLSDKDLGTTLISYLKKYYKHVETDRNNYIYAVGQNPICLVAHIDTCRGKHDEPVMLTEYRNVIRNSKGILGADDRAGVYGILEVVRRCLEYEIPLPSVIFTNYEERGGIGVREFIKSDLFLPEGINLFVELDRKGCNEYVYYSLTLPKKVADYVESFGYRKENGSYSDIADLTNTYEIPSVNVSVGYYQQHSTAEKLHVDELQMTIDRVIDMCNDPIPKLHTVPKPLYKTYRGGAYHGHQDWDDYDNFGSRYKGHHSGTPAKTSTPASTNKNLPAVNKVVDLKKPELAKGTGDKQQRLTFDAENLKQRNAMAILTHIKFDMKAALKIDNNLDSICQRFFNNAQQDTLVAMLGELEGEYIADTAAGIPSDHAWVNAWNNLVTRVYVTDVDKKVAHSIAH